MDATDSDVSTRPTASTSNFDQRTQIEHLIELQRRIKGCMETCKGVIERVQAGGQNNMDDEIAINKLKLFLERFNTELKEYKMKEIPEEIDPQMKEFFELQCDGDELMVALKVHCQIKGAQESTMRPGNMLTSRLPKLELVQFDGDLMNWRRFWTRFHSAVDSKTDISDGDKMSYLVGVLKNEAKQAIAGLDETDQNYAIAISRLKERFGKPEHIIDAHYVALNKLVPADNDIQKCRRVLDKIEQHLRILETLGENINRNNNLRSVIMDKFPETINYDLKMAIKLNGYSVESIRKSLEDIISARETSYPSIQELNRPVTEVPSFTTEAFFSAHKPNNGKSSASLHLQRQNQEPQAKRPRKGCVYCQENHFNDECDKYSTVSERKSKLNNRCYICFGSFHNAINCRFKRKTCFHCKETGHHSSLCPKRFKERPENSTTLSLQSESNTILQTLITDIYDTEFLRAAKGRLLFDTGSQKTYISKNLAKQLKLKPIENLCLTIYTFGQTLPKLISTQLVQVKVKTLHGETIEITAHVIPNITGKIASFQAIKTRIRQEYPNELMADDAEEDSPADLLVGNDQYHTIFTGSTKRIQPNLCLVESKLGWIASGRVNNSVDSPKILTFLTYVRGEHGKGYQQFSVPDPPLQDDNIRQLWDLESIGIREPLKLMEEDDVIRFFNDTTKFHDGRYYVKWPWSQYPSDLPINYGMALGRLTGLLKRTDVHTLKLYDDVLKDQLDKGVIEIVNEPELPHSHPVHYLPHHHVIQENKTTKLRIVYDASAKVKGHCSLNEYLFKGPLMLESLVTLLLNFRTHPIGIIADIEKAFLQVGLQQDDRDVTRFLWVKDVDKEPSKDNLLQFRFCRVPFGLISSPFLLTATVRHHLSVNYSTQGAKIAKDLYVDNLVTGARNVDDAVELFSISRNAFDGLSMNIREWNSNSKLFLDQIPGELRTMKSGLTSVLGVNWNTEQDTLQLAFNPGIVHRTVTTKREILRILASVFDPCGLVAPILLPARLFLQRLWIENYRWDSPLSTEMVDVWNSEVAPLTFIKDVILPRYYFASSIQSKIENSQIELHCFTDASQDAYSAVVYLRISTATDTEINLIMSRTKLTPLKQKQSMTIPKLELLGVLIGTRLLKHIHSTLSLPIRNLYLWTDSKIVLSWLKSSKLLPPFVNKRVTEINSNLGIKHRYIKSEQNPADIATRPLYSGLPKLWFEGPEFLRQPINRWPNEQVALMTIDNALSPIRNDHEQFQPEILNSQTNDNSSIPSSTDLILDQEDLNLPISETEKIKSLQLKHFSLEMHGKHTPLTGSLGLFIDQHGILRCQGRLQNADLPYEQKYPVLLPKLDPFTETIIKKTHEDNHHVGVNHTLALIRQKFWIPQGRSLVGAIIKKCPACVKYGGGPYKLPPMPPLPEERVRLCTPFTYLGLDYLGPLTVIESGQKQKRWVCLFTCMATRAVRLEVVKSLSAEEFLLCLRRFVATQGPPVLIISDNAAQFKLTAEIVQSPLVENHKIAWHFIPELSPWQGGFYERLVGLVKHCLRRTLDKSLINDTQMTTILKEIETVINSRPLTSVGKDIDCILTPSDFLPNCGTHPMERQIEETNSDITATKRELIEGWKRGQNLLKEFSEIFKNHYLTALRERSIATHRQHRVLAKKEPQIGDTVQIWDGQSKLSQRAYWKVGKIVTLIRSNDGLIRTAQVLLDSGTTLKRSIAHLYPLEMDNEEPSRQPDNEPSLSQPKHVNSSQEASPMVDSTEADLVSPSPLLDSTTNDMGVSGNNPSNDEFIEETVDQVPGEEGQSSERPRRLAASLARKTIKKWTENLIALAE